ncbi:hypothetical protein [Paenibacillus aceris]|uniref:YtkA-like domain-containing protein n=1 Tax=Paenibacillus aceris TaxID=869555 RepID=A0ABS4I055_9BACL|nr:hypothetical protein [Paenibacillus aceris]MBP1964289.1 hypothetical protein [Paenibacillus aceris]NHW36610.1 hypothetical protein [Paenibacillus aceris]
MQKIVISILLTALILTACGKSGSGSKVEEMDHSKMAQEAGSNQAENVQAVFKPSTDKIMPNQDTTIMIKIQSKDGKAIDKFDTVHEKQMHFIIVSKDLSIFNHIHPDYKGNGEFTVTTQFPTSGEFKVIADITPTGMGAMSKSQWISVQGSASAPKAIEPDATLTKVVDNKEVTLSFDHLMANMELNLTFTIKDAQTKQPVTDLQPYLGAVGHVVILTQDAENYLHVHPTDEKASGPDAKFMTTFPHSGVYKIWGQFQQNGKVFTVPFVIQVP